MKEDKDYHEFVYMGYALSVVKDEGSELIKLGFPYLQENVSPTIHCRQSMKDLR